MSGPTLTIRIQLRENGKSQLQRTLEVAVLPKVDLDELAERAGRRVSNAVNEMFEDMGEAHSTGNDEAPKGKD